MIENQVVREVPAETDADYFVIKTAEEAHAIIVSNDEYQPYQQAHRWIQGHRVPVMIIHGNAELYEPKLEQSREQK